MQKSGSYEILGWTPSVYYAESLVDCTLETAWKTMLDYEAWNPSFVGATVVRVKGEPSTEGEVVQIKKPLVTVKGEPLPEFFAETVKVVPYRHIVWYVYKPEGAFRNFVNFGISAAPSGVKFNVYYYAQTQLTGEWLIKDREANQSSLDNLAVAFKKYCETHAR